MQYPLLSKIDEPVQLRLLRPEQLPALCAELRQYLQEKAPGKTAHLKSSLGVTELSVTLHYFLQSPEDILIWDVSHQAYLHKLLTGRRIALSGQRKKNGIAGFTSRSESPYDPFGAGHSSTSISAMAGFWKADQLSGRRRRRVAVIGDGALTGGMAFEALNYLGEQEADCWVILNDNRMSIDPNVGALQARQSYPAWAESLGFNYHFLGEGHNTEALLESFARIDRQSGPQFLHLCTEKGRGYQAAKAGVDAQAKTSDFQSAFGENVLELLAENEKLVVLSPAMLSGASLLEARHRFPERVLDVGIAEQHCVTMAAGLAAAGFRPLVHIYSTFAQRALDQIIHDVALQKLPVVFTLDRAGLVGADGATHHGAFDLSFLSAIPNLRLGAPAGKKALREMLRWALTQNEEAIVLRYPKDEYRESHENLWRSYRPHWWKKGSHSAVLSTGSMAHPVQEALQNTSAGHLHLPVFKPFPANDLREQIHSFEKILVVEESTAAGSVGAALQQLAHRESWRAKVSCLHLPDRFVGHASRAELLEEVGLNLAGISEALKNL